MDQRRSKRKEITLKAERVSGDASSAVFIENMSETGIYMITATSQNAVSFSPGAQVSLKLQLSSEKTIDIHCRIVWSYQKMPPEGLTNGVGMEIINPPPEYRRFVQTLR